MHAVADSEPQPKSWTRQQYYQMADIGIFEGQRIELIEGEIVLFDPQSFRHAVAVDRNFELLDRSLGEQCWVRAQLPIRAGPRSEPEPDISAVPGRREDYTDHPDHAVLIVEVSDTTVRFDRRRKASLYASRGVADYWILNLVDDQLEVFRNPRVDAAAPSGFAYDQPTILKRGQSTQPLAAPTAVVHVNDLRGPPYAAQ
jgi:Uma2 family endonuclease